MNKFLTNLIMFIVFVAYVSLVLFIAYKTMNNTSLYIGIPLAIIYAIACFFVKKIRTRMTIWWGILSLLTAIWWIFLLVQ